jgi:type VI secretion system ImpM family protein
MNQEWTTSGCFGKLPAAADYIHHHQGGAGISEFQHWIQDGVGYASSRLGARVETLLRDLRVLEFLWPVARSGACLTGALGPGEDRSGRVFPFTVFAGVPFPPASPVADLVCGRRALRGRAAGLVSRRDADLVALFADVDRLADEDASAPAESSGAFLSREPVARLISSGERFGRVLAGATLNLRGLAARVRREKTPPPYGVRFRLPADPEAAEAAVVVFASMCERVFGERLRPAMFWTRPGAPGFLDVHPQGAGNRAFVHLLDPELDGDGVFAISDPPAELLGAASFADAMRPWSDPRLSLADALRAALPPSDARGVE